MKKGFTLVEILAVIIVLGLVALIATPIIGDIIDDSKKSAFEVSINKLTEKIEEEVLSNINYYYYDEPIPISYLGLELENIEDFDGLFFINSKTNKVIVYVCNDTYCAEGVKGDLVIMPAKDSKPKKIPVGSGHVGVLEQKR